jgi:hypothetical protein
MKNSLIPALMLAVLSALPVRADIIITHITEAECKADYAAMVAEAEGNRLKSIDWLNTALGEAADDAAVDTLNQMIQESWEVEEYFLKLAANMYRDCLKSARPKAS